MIKDTDSKNSILLLVDGLRPSMLGPYGNTWFDTTRLNQLASESLVFEQCISDSPDVQLGLRGILQGTHACGQKTGEIYLPQALVENGDVATLVTDDATKYADYHDCFSQIIEVEVSEAGGLAVDISETQMASFFATATETLQQMDQPGMLLLDCSGFVNCWDAPYSYREELSDPEDPTPSKSSAVPAMQFNAAADDPDQLLEYQTAYGGQIYVFDELLRILLAEIDQSRWASSALFCLASTRGFPLGEHGVVGFYRPVLYNESSQVPLIIRWPISSRRLGRSHQIVQPGSLFQLFSQWHNVDIGVRSQFAQIEPDHLLADKQNMAAVMNCQLEGANHFAIQTASWKYLAGASRQLFVKPDDIWEYNDVAELCQQVAEELDEQLVCAVGKLKDGGTPKFRLQDALAFGVE